MTTPMRVITSALAALIVVACSTATPTTGPSAQPSTIPATGTATATPATPPATTLAPTIPPTTAPPSAIPSPTLGPSPTATVPPSASVAPIPTAASALIEVIAGGGTEAAGNGVSALDAVLQRPTGAAVASDGTIWIVDTNLSLIMHITADGLLADIASGTFGPEGVTVAPDGTVYVADRGGYRIVTPNGSGGVTTVAGDPFNAGFRGDGGRARRALLWQPYDVATDAAGNLFIADTANQRIRVIDATSGNIDTIVGNGTPGFAGDGGSAVDAQLYGPQAIAVDQAGTVLLIADTVNQRLRRVDLLTGIINTISGTGAGAVTYNPLLTGAQTPLVRIAALALDPQGNAYFPVFWGDLGTTIMRLDPAGVLTRVAGGGGSSTAGGPAVEFALPDILGLAIDPLTGDLLICGSDSRVYRVAGVAEPIAP